MTFVGVHDFGTASASDGGHVKSASWEGLASYLPIFVCEPQHVQEVSYMLGAEPGPPTARKTVIAVTIYRSF